MRTGITLNLASTMSTTTTKTTFSPPAAVIQRSPWHSPVPYLFGGLAAMLGLIVFALLILACSYWKLSSRRQSEAERDIESGELKPEKSPVSFPAEYEEKIVVIMAGDVKPSFLATPVRSSSSGAASIGKVEKIEEKKVGQGNENVPEKSSEEEIGGSRRS